MFGRLCLVTLAPSHSILREKKNVQSVSFQVDKKRNRLESQASGKNKRVSRYFIHCLNNIVISHRVYFYVCSN